MQVVDGNFGVVSAPPTALPVCLLLEQPGVMEVGCPSRANHLLGPQPRMASLLFLFAARPCPQERLQAQVKRRVRSAQLQAHAHGCRHLALNGTQRTPSYLTTLQRAREPALPSWQDKPHRHFIACHQAADICQHAVHSSVPQLTLSDSPPLVPCHFPPPFTDAEHSNAQPNLRLAAAPSLHCIQPSCFSTL